MSEPTPPRRSLARNWWLWAAVIAGFVLPPIVITRWFYPREEVPAQVADTLVGPDLPFAGPADADVTVVVFTDYNCPQCRRLNEALSTLLREDPKVRVVFRDWPILGPGSNAGARAALAVQGQGRYPAFHDALMRTRGRVDERAIAQAAARVGVDQPRLARDLNAKSARIDATLAGNARDAMRLGLRGTPGVVVGSVLVNGGLGVDQIRDLVAEARAR